MDNIEKTIQNTTLDNQDKIDWTKAWSKKYSVLGNYQEIVDVKKYSKEIRKLLEELKIKYHYNELDATLVLKDILYHEWKDNQ